MIEIWRDVSGYEGLYEVSNLGRMRSMAKVGLGKAADKPHLILGRKDKDGYVVMCLRRAGKIKNFRLHRLVASTFLPNPRDLPMVNHRNGDKTDNSVTNLEWCTAHENNLHAKQVLGVKNNVRRVAQHSLSGEFLRYFDSLAEAGRAVGVSATAIRACCDGITTGSDGYSEYDDTINVINADIEYFKQWVLRKYGGTSAEPEGESDGGADEDIPVVTP